MNIAHRDLKPENLLLDGNKNIKIVDFGLSNTYKDGELLKTACGSPCYAAPEMIAGQHYEGRKVDIWSSGVILFALVCGYLPFEDPNTADLYKKILAGEFSTPRWLSMDVRDLLKRVLNIDPNRRFSIQQIREHPWYRLSRASREPRGIIIGQHSVPIDEVVLGQLEGFGFDLDYARRCLEGNRHNSVTTTYYLLLSSRLRAGEKSPADLRDYVPSDRRTRERDASVGFEIERATSNDHHTPRGHSEMEVLKKSFWMETGPASSQISVDDERVATRENEDSVNEEDRRPKGKVGTYYLNLRQDPTSGREKAHKKTNSSVEHEQAIGVRPKFLNYRRPSVPVNALKQTQTLQKTKEKRALGAAETRVQGRLRTASIQDTTLTRSIDADGMLNASKKPTSARTPQNVVKRPIMFNKKSPSPTPRTVTKTVKPKGPIAKVVLSPSPTRPKQPPKEKPSSVLSKSIDAGILRGGRATVTPAPENLSFHEGPLNLGTIFQRPAHELIVEIKRCLREQSITYSHNGRFSVVCDVSNTRFEVVVKGIRELEGFHTVNIITLSSGLSKRVGEIYQQLMRNLQTDS
eukprot:TRINITY_DN7670_c0_g1_i1.p1 TRINITY_DN7670_c0_g1~~TRINITY_DN7670_c0_g1_i1.p1  ORF type:complete len:577 (-),score=103.56 TRINITY_DN7670_c0_g1_i1:201-1931(-)